MVFTSAKSRLMIPGMVMMSLMPCTAWRRISSAMRNASKKLVPFSTVFHQAFVGNHHHGINAADQLGQGLLGLLQAPLALECKWFGDHRHGQRAKLAG